jgi:hypothetical protein
MTIMTTFVISRHMRTAVSQSTLTLAMSSAMWSFLLCCWSTAECSPCSLHSLSLCPYRSLQLLWQQMQQQCHFAEGIPKIKKQSQWAVRSD